MPRPKLDALRIWTEIEDRLIPRLQITMPERAVYYHLLRHTHIEGRRTRLISLGWLARGTLLSTTTVRDALRSLTHKGVLRLLHRSRDGHYIQVQLPAELPECKTPEREPPPLDLETANFYEDKRLREAIFRREGGRCFYCRRQLGHRTRALDHVIPRPAPAAAARIRRPFIHSYRNLVCACPSCNFCKADQPAANFLRRLYRDGRLNARELRDRLRQLKALQHGRLKPVLSTSSRSLPCSP